MIPYCSAFLLAMRPAFSRQASFHWFVLVFCGLLLRRRQHFTLNGRCVLVGDHTKTPKDARKMPAVVTLHQESESSSKPSFFRGHHWGCISLLFQSTQKFFSVPLEARIQQGLDSVIPNLNPHSISVQLIRMALEITRGAKVTAYLALDAYFASGPVFQSLNSILYGLPNHWISRVIRQKREKQKIPSAAKIKLDF